MDNLVGQVRQLQKGPVKRLVRQRMQEFKAVGGRGNNALFKELCFCTLTANFDAAKAIAIQEKAGNAFLEMPAKRLESRLRKLGYRYPNRAAFICENRQFKKGLKGWLECVSSEKQARQWLAENVKGLGFKEASHFLRNIGFENLAIIDFHILDLLEKEKLVERPKTMTKKRYLEIEKVLESLAEKAGVSLAELDLYLWFLETGKVLK